MRCVASRLGISIGRDVCLALELAPADRAALEDAAHTRGMTTGTLAIALLQMVARDNLTDAVLDDRPEPKPAPPPVRNGQARAAHQALQEAAEIKRLMAGGMDVFEAMREVAAGAMAACARGSEGAERAANSTGEIPGLSAPFRDF